MLTACGLNHKTTSISVREKCTFTGEILSERLLELKENRIAEEVAILSTCNRTEIYCNQAASESMIDWLAKHCHMAVSDLRPHLYLYQEKAAFQHVIRVACGLDSLAIGEPQILGQMKSAYFLAQQTGTIGPNLRSIFPQVFSAAKHIRHYTALGQSPISIASISMEWLKQIFTDLKQQHYLLVGSGDVIKSVYHYLYQLGARNFTVVSRRPQHGLSHYPVKTVQYGHLSEALSDADVVFSATQSPVPVIGKGMIERVLKQRNRALVLLDLAVPRDIEPEVAALSNVFLCNVDHLQSIMKKGLLHRQSAATQAEQLVDAAANHLLSLNQMKRSMKQVIDFRQQQETVRDQMIHAAKQALQNGQAADIVIEKLANQLVNKLMHYPTVQLKKLAYQGEQDLFEQLYGLLISDETIDL